MPISVIHSNSMWQYRCLSNKQAFFSWECLHCNVPHFKLNGSTLNVVTIYDWSLIKATWQQQKQWLQESLVNSVNCDSAVCTQMKEFIGCSGYHAFHLSLFLYLSLMDEWYSFYFYFIHCLSFTSFLFQFIFFSSFGAIFSVKYVLFDDSIVLATSESAH